jgi:hypothetical protein
VESAILGVRARIQAVRRRGHTSADDQARSTREPGCCRRGLGAGNREMSTYGRGRVSRAS